MCGMQKSAVTCLGSRGPVQLVRRYQAEHVKLQTPCGFLRRRRSKTTAARVLCLLAKVKFCLARVAHASRPEYRNRLAEVIRHAGGASVVP
jgi:hypothetical protein